MSSTPAATHCADRDASRNRSKSVAGGDFGAVLEAIAAPGLFAPAVIVSCRILRARGAGDDDSGEAGRGPRSAQSG